MKERGCQNQVSQAPKDLEYFKKNGEDIIWKSKWEQVYHMGFLKCFLENK